MTEEARPSRCDRGAESREARPLEIVVAQAAAASASPSAIIIVLQRSSQITRGEDRPQPKATTAHRRFTFTSLISIDSSHSTSNRSARGVSPSRLRPSRPHITRPVAQEGRQSSHNTTIHAHAGTPDVHNTRTHLHTSPLFWDLALRSIEILRSHRSSPHDGDLHAAFVRRCLFGVFSNLGHVGDLVLARFARAGARVAGRAGVVQHVVDALPLR